MSQFLVTTPGASATRWLCFALAARSDVFVTHGKFALDSVTAGKLVEERREGDLGSITRGNALREFYAARTVPQIFEAYRQFAPASAAQGNVHTFTIHELLQREAQGQALDGVRIANLTRHPISFVESHTALVQSSAGQPDLWAHYQNEFREVVARCPEVLLVPCDNPTDGLAFAVSCLGARRAALDLATRRWPNVRMEDVTVNREALQQFCSQVTGLDYPAEVLDAVMSAGAINSHRKRAPRTAAETWEAWPGWKRDLFQLFVDAELFDLWQTAGYDVRAVLNGNTGPNAKAPDKCLGDYTAELGLRRERSTIELLEESFHGFSLLRAGDEAIALASSLGEVDWQTVKQSTLSRWEREGLFFTGASVEVLKEVVVTRPPRLIGECGQHNLLAFRGRIVGLAQSLGSVDLTLQTECQMRQLQSDGNLVWGNTLDEVCAALPSIEAGSDCAAIAEELTRPEATARSVGRCGDFQVVEVAGWFHAFAVELGDISLSECRVETLAEWRTGFRWSFHPSEAVLRDWCRNNRCEGELPIPGFRVVRYRSCWVAISEILGEVDLPYIPGFLLDRWKAAGRCFVTLSREDLWQAVYSANPPKPAGQLYDWTMWRFLNRSLALAEGTALPKTEAEFMDLQTQERLVVAGSPDAVREAVLARVPPRLVDAGFHGFNLLEYRLEFFALSETLGPVELATTTPQQLAAWQGQGQVLRAPTLEELWLEVLFQEPRLLMELPGFNVVGSQGKIVALSQALGAVDIQHVSPDTQAEWSACGLWIEAPTLEQVEHIVESQHRRWLATDRYGWDLFAYRGRIWAVVHGELGGPVESVTDSLLDDLAREGQGVWGTNQTAVELMCLQRRAEELATRLRQVQEVHQLLQQKWVLRLGRGARRMARLPRRLAAAGWRRVAQRLFSL